MNPQRVADLIESQRVSLMAMALSAKRAKIKDRGLLMLWRLAIAANYEIAKAAGVDVPSISDIHDETLAEVREIRKARVN